MKIILDSRGDNRIKMARVITIFFVFTSSFALGQSTNVSTFFTSNLKKADRFYEKEAFQNALELYHHVVEKASNNLWAHERIGLCYVKLHDPVSAERWFALLVEKAGIRPEILYEYAEVLSMNRKYNESLSWFETYLKHKPQDTRAIDKIIFLKNIHHFLDDSLRYGVKNSSINTPHADFGAHYYKNGVVFISGMDQHLFIKRQPTHVLHEDESFLNIFYADVSTDGNLGQRSLFSPDHLKTSYHDGPISFYDKDTKAVFSRTNTHEGGKLRYHDTGLAHLKLYFADVDADHRFRNIKPFEHNDHSHSIGHPYITSDGKLLFFSANLANGFGGADLYYSVFNNGSWSAPVNLGPSINTEEDEIFPFLSNDSTLYFSSEGHGSLGGFDVLVSYRNKDGKFAKPINLGAVINSSYDDFALVTDNSGRQGFLTSNRPGGKGQDDIYSFVSYYFMLAGEVFDFNDRNVTLPDVSIHVYNEKTGALVDSTQSDKNGYFMLNLPYDTDFKITAKKEGYDVLDDIGFSTHGLPLGTDSLLIPMVKQQLFAKGRIFSHDKQQLLPGTKVTLENKTENSLDTLVVGNNGEYSFRIRPNRRYRIQAQKEGFIPNGFDLNTAKIFKGELLNDIVLEEIFVDKGITFFEFDKWDILREYEEVLNQVLKTLLKAKTSTVNINAHADARGTPEYNQSLSERRAQAIVQYFIKNGISPKRITSRGYGETLLLNRCSDGVECPEEDHAQNRRSEIKVQIKP